MFSSISPYYEPVDNILNIKDIKSEMTREEMAFICSLIKENSPRKIVEIGVASGGTTAVILECNSILNLDAVFYSVDLSEKMYRDNTRQTGYLVDEIVENKKKKSHQFLLGKYLPERLEKIGKEIDFVILDTVHKLPGELLDFSAILPFLSDKAIVVLHDVALQHNNSANNPSWNATQILFSIVKGKKYINFKDKYPNIAAFSVDKSTRDNISDVFSAMTLVWAYLPEIEELEIYKKWYANYYDSSILNLFNQAISLNQKTLSELNIYTIEYLKSIGDSFFNNYKHILLYGAGKRGRALLKAFNAILTDEIVKKVQFVVTDSKEASKLGCLEYDKVKKTEGNFLFIRTAAANEIKETLIKDKQFWIDIPNYIWSSLDNL